MIFAQTITHLRSTRLVAWRFVRLSLFTGCVVLAHCAHATAAGIVEDISFESGTIGAFGSPASTGWQFDTLNRIAKIESVNANRPAFENGTNQEALLYNPWIAPSNFTPHSGPRQSVVWEKQFDSADAGLLSKRLIPAKLFFFLPSSSRMLPGATKRLRRISTSAS